MPEKYNKTTQPNSQTAPVRGRRRKIEVACVATLVLLAAMIVWILTGDLSSEQVGSLESVTKISEAEIGDTVTFGCYEQDDDLSNGAEAIEWIVLDKKDGRVLLLSKVGLDAKPYNKNYEDVTWKNCSLRAWLNDEFLTAAFSKTERGYIKETLIKNEDNTEYGIKGGKDTSDRVFLLSAGEVTAYFDSDPYAEDPARKTKLTEYAMVQGGRCSMSDESFGYGWWWLRSPGNTDRTAASVDISGKLDRFSFMVNSFSIAVRPAIWIAP